MFVIYIHENFVAPVSYRMILENRKLHIVPASFMAKGDMIEVFRNDKHWKLKNKYLLC